MTFKEEKAIKNTILFDIYSKELHNTDMNEIDYVSVIERRLIEFGTNYQRKYEDIKIINPKRRITIINRIVRMAINELPYQTNERVKIHLNSIIKRSERRREYITSKLK